MSSAAKSEGGGREWELHKLGSLKAQPGSHHHFSNTETYQLAAFINARFADEPLLSSILPVDGTNPDSFFDAWGDGKLLICLVDAACDGVVDLAFLRRRAAKPLGVSVRHLTIQHFAVLNDALEGCKNIDGLRLGFVGAEDFVQGNRPVILGVGWQLVRMSILRKVHIVERPELADLFTPEEAAKSIGQTGQEEVVLSRWFNQFLEAVGSDRQVWSFGAELADGVAWCTLLNAIDPAACPPPDESDAEANVSSVMAAVGKMDIKGVFLTEDALMAADKKQNVMFCAQLADAFPTLPNHLRAPRSSKSSARGGGNGGGGGGNRPFSSSYHSRDGSSTAASSMYTSSPNEIGGSGSGRRAVGSSSAPAPLPSPPKSRWGFGFNTSRGAGGDAEVGEGKIYYDSDGEVDSGPGCGLGGFAGLFSCITRN
ncbi:unnamed protein product [Scytosiphon promiscuus]